MSSMELLRRTLPPFMGPQCHDPVTSHTLPPPPRPSHWEGGFQHTASGRTQTRSPLQCHVFGDGRRDI